MDGEFGRDGVAVIHVISEKDLRVNFQGYASPGYRPRQSRRTVAYRSMAPAATSGTSRWSVLVDGSRISIENAEMASTAAYRATPNIADPTDVKGSV